jgi:hypothetical protein
MYHPNHARRPDAAHSSHVRLTGRGWAVLLILWFALAWFIESLMPVIL